MSAFLVAVAVGLVTLWHAHVERRHDALAAWLADNLGFQPAHWLANVLWLLAVAAILGPVAFAFVDGRAWGVAAGALLGDALLTHILPTLLTGRPVPATKTWPLQALAAIGCVAMVPGGAIVGTLYGPVERVSTSVFLLLAVGAALFAPLRPTLRLLMAFRVLRPVAAGEATTPATRRGLARGIVIIVLAALCALAAVEYIREYRQEEVWMAELCREFRATGQCDWGGTGLQFSPIACGCPR
jgi:hypothetical protein